MLSMHSLLSGDTAMFFILKDRKPIPVGDMLEWGMWMEANDRVVKQEQVQQFKVSTVFLGINHQWGTGPPLLFETMIFDPERGVFTYRCSTWEQAEEAHAAAVATVERGVSIPGNWPPQLKEKCVW